MIAIVTGDMFQEWYDIRVNPVNCIGVMGAGLALEFKRRYPNMFIDYQRACPLKLGTLHIYCDSIVNLPTKYHWRDRSSFHIVAVGLDALRAYLLARPPARVAVPALGCGLGQLPWYQVVGLVHDKLADVDHTVHLYKPHP